MDLLAELVFIIMQKPSGLLDQYLPRNSKTRIFFELLSKGNIQTDEEAAWEIYHTSPRDKKYLMLKRNLVNKLTEIVLITQYFDHSDYLSMEQECERELIIVSKLLAQNVFHNAEKILNRVQETANLYHLNEISIKCLRQFRTINTMKGYTEKVMECEKQMDPLMHTAYRLSKAIGWLSLLQSQVKYFISGSESLVKNAERYYKQLKEWELTESNLFFRYYRYQIGIIKNLQTRDVNSALIELKLYNDLLADHPHLNTLADKLNLHYSYALVYRMLKQFEKSVMHIEKCLEISDYKAFNKFAIQAVHFDLQLKINNLEKVVEIWEEVKSAPQFHLLFGPDKAAWSIRLAYFYYVLLKNKKTELAKAVFPEWERKFDLNSFSNQCKPVSKDKQGYNLMAMVVRLLLLKENKAVDLQNEGENLRIYFYRYLNTGESSRTKIFVKALYKLAQSDFNKTEIPDKSAYFFKKLEETNAGATLDMAELVMYEELWSLICSE